MSRGSYTTADGGHLLAYRGSCVHDTPKYLALDSLGNGCQATVLTGRVLVYVCLCKALLRSHHRSVGHIVHFGPSARSIPL